MVINHITLYLYNPKSQICCTKLQKNCINCKFVQNRATKYIYIMDNQNNDPYDIIMSNNVVGYMLPSNC